MAEERVRNIQRLRRRFRRQRSPARLQLRAAKLPYQKRETLLSRGELAFYRVLRQAVSHRYSISIKTRLADVLKCPDNLWDTTHGRKLSQKHIDFVLYDSWTARIIAAIELDDRSHESVIRRERDAFIDDAMRDAGVPLVRIKAASRYDPTGLYIAIDGAICGLRT